MKVGKFFEEDWQGAQLRAVEHRCTNVNQAYAALDRLDGVKKTMVEYRVNDDAILTVGGDGKKFVVSLTLDTDGELYTLINPSKSANDYEDVVAGGQSGSYPANQCVDKNTVKEAVGYFCEHGIAAPNLTWLHE